MDIKEQEEHPAETQEESTITSDPYQPQTRRRKLQMLVTTVALVGSLYALYALKDVKQEIRRNQAQFMTLHEQQSHIEKALETMIANMNQTLGTVESRLQTMRTQLEGVSGQKQMDTQTGMLYKARFDLELAQLNNQWGLNQDAALTSLQQAEKLLSAHADANVAKIRELVSQDIEALKEHPKPPLAHLFNQLNQALVLIDQLPLMPLFPAQNAQKTPGNGPSASVWKQSLATLDQLIIIKHHDQDIIPTLSPMMQELAKQKLKLNLQEAQWALLQSDQELYDQSLKQALNTLQQSCDLHAAQSQALLNQLQDLQKVSFAEPKAHISQALELLDQYLSNSSEDRP